MVLGDAAYAALTKFMAAEAGIAATHGSRRNAEQRYFLHHKVRGVRLRGRYRLT